jgi:hypothetical protein
VIKGVSSAYVPGAEGLWMKLKWDYIEGFGDTATVAVVGARYGVRESGFLGVDRSSDAELVNVFYVGFRTANGKVLIFFFTYSKFRR